MIKMRSGVKYDNYDGVLFFKTITGKEGHIVLHSVDSVFVNTETNELTINNFNHGVPEIVVEEIYINLISDFFEVLIEPIDENIIEISCKITKKMRCKELFE